MLEFPHTTLRHEADDEEQAERNTETDDHRAQKASEQEETETHAEHDRCQVERHRFARTKRQLRPFKELLDLEQEAAVLSEGLRHLDRSLHECGLHNVGILGGEFFVTGRVAGDEPVQGRLAAGEDRAQHVDHEADAEEGHQHRHVEASPCLEEPEGPGGLILG